MKIFEIIESYSLEDYTTFVLTEQKGSWTVSQTSAYKRAFKKYSREARVIVPLEKLLAFIEQYDRPPPVSEYPPEHNVHMLQYHSVYDRPLWAHLMGSRIGLIFKVLPGEIQLLCLGTHDDCKVGKF